jgi:hypothetical protein
MWGAARDPELSWFAPLGWSHFFNLVFELPSFSSFIRFLVKAYEVPLFNKGIDELWITDNEERIIGFAQLWIDIVINWTYLGLTYVKPVPLLGRSIVTRPGRDGFADRASCSNFGLADIAKVTDHSEELVFRGRTTAKVYVGRLKVEMRAADGVQLVQACGDVIEERLDCLDAIAKRKALKNFVNCSRGARVNVVSHRARFLE